MLPIAVVAMLAIVGVGAVLLWRRRLGARALEDDVLKRFYQDRQQGRTVSLEGLAGMLGVPLTRVGRCVTALMERGLVRAEGPSLHLTPLGRQAADERVRSHRVLETFLAERGGRPVGLVHRLADRLEHRVPPERIDAMERSLGHPVRDPHGDLIPGPTGRGPDRRRVPLSLCPPGSVVRVLHVEDEPDQRFAELLAQGLAPGTELEVLASGDDGVRVTLAARGERTLDPWAAAMVDVVPSGIDADELRGLVPLSDLDLDRAGRVVMLTNELAGDARRRLLDLGFTPGARVTPVLTNALGRDPTAYLIRQSRIALRREQARSILVVRVPHDGDGDARGEAAA